MFRFFQRFRKQKQETERVNLNGRWVDVPKRPQARLHPDGVPVGMKPGDPVDPDNFMAIFDFVQRQGQPLGDIAPGESKSVRFPFRGTYQTFERDGLGDPVEHDGIEL